MFSKYYFEIWKFGLLVLRDTLLVTFSFRSIKVKEDEKYAKPIPCFKMHSWQRYCIMWAVNVSKKQIFKKMSEIFSLNSKQAVNVLSRRGTVASNTT